jgi:hypothetical protein
VWLQTLIPYIRQINKLREKTEFAVHTITIRLCVLAAPNNPHHYSQSEAERLFIVIATEAKRLFVVIPTTAKRIGGICFMPRNLIKPTLPLPTRLT